MELIPDKHIPSVFKLANGTGLLPIYKSGTTSFARAIIEQENSVLHDLLTNKTSRPQGNTFETSDNRSLVPVLDDTSKTITSIAVAFRNPIERFISAVVEINKKTTITVDELLTEIESGVNDRLETISVVEYIDLTSKRYLCEFELFKFDEQLDALVSFLGLTSIPQDNIGLNKPTLTAEQIQRVELIYADDITLLGTIGATSLTYSSKSNKYIPIVMVPTLVSSRQFKLQLHYQGDLALIEAMVAQQPIPIRIEWDNAISFERAWDTLNQMVAYLQTQDPKWSSEYVDTTFINAFKL